MDEQKKPRSREKRVVSEGKGVEKKGEGLGIGPVNNTGNYEDRRAQEQARQQAANTARTGGASQRPAQSSSGTQRPMQSPFGQRPSQSSSGTQRPTQSPFEQQSQRPSQQSSGTQRPTQQSTRPAGSSSSGGQPAKQYNSATRQNGTGGQRTGGQRASGGGGKLLLIVVAVAVLLGGGKLFGLFGGDGGDSTGGLQSVLSTVTGTQTSSGTSTNNGTSTSSGSSSNTGTSTGTSSILGDSGSSGGLMNLLSSFLSSGSSSVYDMNGLESIFSQVAGSQTSQSGSSYSGSSSSGTQSGSSSDYTHYFTADQGDNSAGADETVASGAREKYTRILGKGKDTVTILVYMCGADLESQQGMATSDLKEMVSANLSDQVNLIVYTGGARKWKNNVVSANTNQIYQIRDGGLYCLEDNLGTASMTNPSTLTSFIRYGQEHFPANRMCLIFWDHGGGSISGYGYDERYGQGQSMTLIGINTALQNGGVKFDMIGFDTCLMATVENGLMLSQYGDYLVASEETEPGVGWYYTNWLNKLSQNTSLSTVQLGKQIADDFVEVCDRKCRGQSTTLSVVDLAELQATVPKELKAFGADTNAKIQNSEYQKVSTARSRSREFAQQSRIDQVDLVHFARNMGTEAGTSLAKALQSAIKYNRTGGGISNTYGLSIYFPYKRTAKVNQMVATYQTIGMDEEYTRCIQEFASLEVSGQVSAGTSIEGYGTQTTAWPGLMDVLMGGSSGSAYGSSSGSSYGSSYTSSGLTDLLGGLFGGSGSSGGLSGTTGSILDLFGGRTMTAERAAAYILDHHFDESALTWDNQRITLDKEQWSLVTEVFRNVFYDDGKGFIDLGTDPEYTVEGNTLVGTFDGTWLSVDGQPVAYYYLDTVEEGDNYVISGYVPALLNGERVDLMLLFDSERPNGYLSGARKVYEGQSDTQGKELIAIGEGDRVQFLCDYFDYQGNWQDTYRLGDEITLGAQVEIANTPIGGDDSEWRVTYCFTDLYQQQHWTPKLEW